MTPTCQRAKYAQRHEIADRDFLEHAAEETGQGCSPEAWAKQILSKTTIKEQTEALAQNLEAARKLAYREMSFFLAKWWVHSRKLEQIPQYRRICLLPYIAAIVRASKLAALEYFLQRNRYARFWTFTTGIRCDLAGLRPRIAFLHRRLSRLSAFLREKFGVELVFRSTEFGTVERAGGSERSEGRIEFDEATGEPLFHVHAHVVVNSLVGRLSKARWAELIKAVWDFWTAPDGTRAHWDADGVIRDAREVCKYVTKPADLLSLSPDHIGRLHEAIFRMKLCQPMGTLAKEIRDRKNNPNGRKVLRRYAKKDHSGKRVGFEWREVFDHNEQAPISKEEREAADEWADCERFAAEQAASDVAGPSHVKETMTTVWDDGETVRETVSWTPTGRNVKEPPQKADFCRVMSRLSPSVGPNRRKEPCVIVAYTRFDEVKIDRHPLVQRLWAQTVQQWEEAAERAPGKSEGPRHSAPGAQREGSPLLGERGKGREGQGSSSRRGLIPERDAKTSPPAGGRSYPAFERLFREAGERNAGARANREVAIAESESSESGARAARISVHTDTPTVRDGMGYSQVGGTSPPGHAPPDPEYGQISV